MKKISLTAVALGLALLMGAALIAPNFPAQAQTPPTPVAPLQSVPPIPMVLGGEAAGAPDGFTILARIGGYESQPTTVKNGRYLLTIAPPTVAYTNSQVSVFLEGVEANERVLHIPGNTNLRHNLTFPRIPEATLVPTAVPILPAIYSGTITIAGASVPTNARLVARVGDYESEPALISEDGSFTSLVIATTDDRLVTLPVELFLNGIPSTPSAHGVFNPGEIRFLTLVFQGVPPTPTPTPLPTETPTPLPTATPVPPTATPEPPTATPVPPTATPVPPTATPVPPTATPVPPTATPEPPPTATPAPPTATPEPPPVAATAEPEEPQGGACSAPSRHIPFGEGAANALMMFAPLALAGGALRMRRNRRNR